MNAAAPSGDLNVPNNSTTDIFGGEAGIVKALSTLRQAAITPEEKSSLRDLFLSYAGESDEAKRKSIKGQIVEKISKTPQLASLISNPSEVANVPETINQTNSINQLGQTRPRPNFVAPEVKSVTAAPTEPSVASAPEPKVEAVAPLMAPEVVPAQAVTPPPAQVMMPEPAPIETKPTPLPTEEKPAEVQSSAPTPVTTTDVRARIDTIKHDINGRVGNPVNVINADETIGREYMSALLDAMKKSSTGGGAEVLPRLEAAYKATLDLIKEKGLGKSGDTRAEVEAQEIKASEAPAPTPEVLDVAPASQALPTPEVIVPTVESEPTPQPEPEPEIKEEPPKPEPLQQSEGLYHRPSDEIEAEAEPQKDRPASLASRFFKSTLHKEEPKEEAPAITNESVVNVRKVEVKPTPLTTADTASVSRESDKLQPLKNLSATLPEKMAAIKSAAAKREEEAKKPITDLKSPEIEAGLRQLLSEWVLFKKSGFLGTGPSGIDHPLYKQLSVMPMASVISGRFEGVTPEIKRHLSDYMTGWRYEQGVMHEMGETFENYLRRVIRQVLERQRTQATKES